ncbi:MAG: phosphate signaling complex protein PhoU [Actinomycetota bacterium]
MQETRHRFHQALTDLEHELLAEGEDAADAVGLSLEALVHRDPGLAHRVVAGDDAIDERYLEIETRILEVLALQTPVASDLRLVSAILHINLHLERIGDQAVNVAKMAEATADLPREEQILGHLQEMGEISTRMVRVAMDAFARRDLALCLTLPAMDDPVDLLNRNMYRQVLALGGGDPAALEWGIRMNVVARQLERVGDNAVDIAEQVGFLLTGEFREFTDASHDGDG